jgi:methylmalonyl-CoA/ethylmalonyl-CoA epimerase
MLNLRRADRRCRIQHCRPWRCPHQAVCHDTQGENRPGWEAAVLLRIDHVGIACRNLDEAIERYESAFGLTVASREDSTEQGVREAMLEVGQAGGGSSWVQLLEPLGPDTPVGRFLARRGEGVHHIGYAVADIDAALAELGGSQIRLIDERPRHGSMGAAIAFLHPADLGGVLTELVQPAAR